MLADAEGDVAPRVRCAEKSAAAVELRLRRLDEVGRAAEHRRRERLERLHHLLAGVARRDASPASNSGSASSQPGRGSPGRAPGPSPRAAPGRPRSSARSASRHSCSRLDAALRLGHVLAHRRRARRSARRDPSRAPPSSRAPRPRRAASRAPSPCRLACGAGRRCGVRTTMSDGRSVSRLRRVERPPRARRGPPTSSTCCTCQPYASKRLPTSSVVNESVSRAVDRDLVVVVEVDELAEPEVAGDRRGLGRDALHQVAVGADRVDAVVDDLVARAVEALGEEALGDRHADAVREALAERAGRRLDARR